MRTPRPLTLAAAIGGLGALGLLAPATPLHAAPVDTSAWACKSCPYEATTTGKVTVGVGRVSEQAPRYIDRTGLDEGSHLVLGGQWTYSDGAGLYGSLHADELGLDTRSFGGELGVEGVARFRFNYDTLPRRFGTGALSPYLGSGSGVLSLPAGYPQETTSAMPLAATLKPVTLGYERSRLDAGVQIIGSGAWTYSVEARRDERDGTRAGSAAFFSTAAQMAVPVALTTNQIDATVRYNGRQLQGTLSYHLSKMSNAQPSLTFANPFAPFPLDAARGQLALAPDNQFHQIAASVGYDIAPRVRASADVAVGRMEQNAAYVAATLTPSLAGLAPLPATSLNGRADTFNAGARITFSPLDDLRINASYARDVRESDTPVLNYTQVATDMFVRGGTRANRPYSYWRDRVRVVGDYRLGETTKLDAGIERDSMERTYAEAVTTDETTVWGRISTRPLDDLALSFKASSAKRKPSQYGVATWIDEPQNPLMRKYHLAQRERLASSLRADWTVSETLSVGASLDSSQDRYTESVIGLRDGRRLAVTLDTAWAVTEQTQLRLYAQGETMRTFQAGSALSGQPDWSGRVKDSFSVLGLGARHRMLDDKLELDADLTFSRARSDTTVLSGVDTSPFPTDRVSIDGLKLGASYQLKDNLTLLGSLWRERYESQDWRIDGVRPDTVPYLLTFGQTSPKYSVNVLRVALRLSY